jgi:hypothetical protein
VVIYLAYIMMNEVGMEMFNSYVVPYSVLYVSIVLFSYGM